jgi:putative transposase
MKRNRHTPEQIIRKLKTADHLIAQGQTVADVCRVVEMTQPTYHRWRQQYGGTQAEEAKPLRGQISSTIRRLILAPASALHLQPLAKPGQYLPFL